jgi:hypothetical protein
MSAHRLSRTSGGTHDYHGRAVGRGSRLNSKLRKGGMRPARLTRLERPPVQQVLVDGRPDRLPDYCGCRRRLAVGDLVETDGCLLPIRGTNIELDPVCRHRDREHGRL